MFDFLSGLKDVFTPKYVRKKRSMISLPLIEIEHTLHRFLEGKKDKHNWVVDDCDAMLWQGKYGATGNSSASVQSASLEKGKYQRRPKNNCYDTKESGSSWSKDMAMGFLWWCYKTGNVKALDDHFRFGQLSLWVMGEGEKSRTIYTPQLVSLFDQARFKMKKRKYSNWKKIPYIFPKGLEDYHAHLQTLAILMIGEINGKIPKTAFERLEEHFKRAPRNPLYAAAMYRYGGQKYSSDAVSACIRPVFDTYVRGGDKETVQAIETIFAISIILR